MKEEITKHPLNVKGKYYVDCNCIDHCCYDIAPSNFKQDEDNYQTYVFKQPENTEEERLCKEVVLYCPIEAVHDDGESEKSAMKTVIISDNLHTRRITWR